MTMDLETRKINGKLYPVCLCIYDGKDKKFFTIDNYKNSGDLLEAGLKSIMKRKYFGWRVYLHNFSYFDGIFLLRKLAELGKIKNPIINDNKLIQVPFNFGEKSTIYFYDSYLLLPDSLKNLAKSFTRLLKSGFWFEIFAL